MASKLHLPMVALAAFFFACRAPAQAACDTHKPACRGCGCKGGPGYREIATPRCVGFKTIDKICGNPPKPALCVFENAPGTGDNKECALTFRKRKATEWQ